MAGDERGYVVLGSIHTRVTETTYPLSRSLCLCNCHKSLLCTAATHTQGTRGLFSLCVRTSSDTVSQLSVEGAPGLCCSSKLLTHAYRVSGPPHYVPPSHHSRSLVLIRYLALHHPRCSPQHRRSHPLRRPPPAFLHFELGCFCFAFRGF